MTLVLEIAWSAPVTTVRLRDTVARSVVAEAHAPHEAGATPFEQEPSSWWVATVAAVREVLDAQRAMGLAPEEVGLVLVDDGAPAGGLVVLDDDGAVVRPALLGEHEPSGADADWLLGQLPGGEDAWVAATGARPVAGSTVALLSWLHRSDSEAWHRFRRLQLPSGWLVERLSGAHRLSAHAAIGTGVIDRGTGRDWRTDLLAVVDAERDWAAALPQVVVPADPVGGLTAQAAAELGLRELLPVHAGSALPTRGSAGG
jgi:xylulokinase